MQNEDITAGALPMIDLTPIKVISTAAPALLRAAVAKKPTTVTVDFKECVVVEATEDETIFDLSFTVNVLQEGEESPEQREITKRVVVSNETLAEEARLGQEGMAKIIENQKSARAESRRMRELAGIPHKDNFV